MNTAGTEKPPPLVPQPIIPTDVPMPPPGAPEPEPGSPRPYTEPVPTDVPLPAPDIPEPDEPRPLTPEPSGPQEADRLSGAFRVRIATTPSFSQTGAYGETSSLPGHRSVKTCCGRRVEGQVGGQVRTGSHYERSAFL
jgi:hypothetical protein